jgi:Flp pilus assembly pilin Flp
VSAIRSTIEHRPTRRPTAEMQLRDWFEFIRLQLRREDGQTMTEYGVLLALIVVGVVGVLFVLGPKIIAAFSYVNNHL